MAQFSPSEIASSGALAISNKISEEVLQLLVGPLHLTIGMGVVSRRQAGNGVGQLAVGLPEPGSELGPSV